MASTSNQSRLTIGLLPYKLEANAYIDKNRQILGRIGNVAPVAPPKPLLIQALKQFVKTGRLRLYDVLIVNWRENTLTNGNNNLHLAGILEYFCSLLLHRAVSKKLVYVKHNTTPHNLSPDEIGHCEKIISVALRIVSAVVVHSPEHALNPKTFYVPHPLYDTNVNANNIPEVKKNEYIMIGRVLPYKKIDEVISQWCCDSTLTIMGPCSDQKYLNKLRRIGKNKNVIFEIDFHPEDYLQSRIRTCRGVIITNDSSSMLVSGSFFYSISCGTKVYALETPFFSWIKTTEIREFIALSRAINDLTNCIKNERYEEKLDVGSLMNKSYNLFGDQIVEEKWKSMFIILND